MGEHDWLRLVYLAGLLVLVLPALFMYRRSGNRLWRDLALWCGIAGAAALLYYATGPGR
jgi:hypothetical protein